jgi:hypothetical protein
MEWAEQCTPDNFQERSPGPDTLVTLSALARPRHDLDAIRRTRVVGERGRVDLL